METEESGPLAVDDARQHVQRPNHGHAYSALLGCAILQLPVWGVAMSFGIFQDAYAHNHVIRGAGSAAGVVGTTMNGVMYLSMPFLFTPLDRGRWAQYRRAVATTGVFVSGLAFLLSSFSTQLWHLVLLQGVLSAFGNALVYSPTTLYLDEHFPARQRATAYGAIYSSKNIVGSACPIVLSVLIQRLGFRWTLRIWAATVLLSGALGLSFIPKSQPTNPTTSPPPPRTPPPRHRRRPAQKTPWSFLRHRTFYIYSIANAVFSSGYGIPQTYLSSYARDTQHFSALSSALMITLFNAPGIISCVGFGLLSDKAGLSSTTNTFISACGSCLSALLLWGLASDRFPAVLILFAVSFGFFSGGYSSTWGGWIKDFEREAGERNEAVNTGMLVGMFNGARGLGYVVSGVAGVELLGVGAVQGVTAMRFGYGTRYGALILFTGLSSIVGCWSVLWKGWGCLRKGR